MNHFSVGRQVPLLVVAAGLLLAPAMLSEAVLPELTRLVVLIGAAMSLNILVGTTGLISMGQGIFLGFGAYVVAIATIRFGMNYWTAGLLCLVVVIPLAALIGLLSLRARHLFFGLLTMAIGQVAFVAVTLSYSLTGGDDGLVGVVVPAWLEGDLARYFFATGVAIAVCIGLLWLLGSPFGMMLRAVRDNSARVASLGGNPKVFELMAFTLAGTVGTVFGVLYAATEGGADPHLFSWTTSATLLMMVALGGRSLFTGPIIGGVLLEIPRTYAQVHTSHADLVVGAIVVVCAVMFPEGIGPPLYSTLRNTWARKRAGPTDANGLPVEK
jgi:branched-chain amino acid transport system permease protein